MRIVSIIFFCLFFLLACPGCRPTGPAAQLSLAGACRWLWAQQSPDGGWHSTTHGILKGGEAFTPFVLHTLLSVPDSIFPLPAAQVKLGLDFIRKSIDPAGHVGAAGAQVLEYPNYATAYALRVLSRYGTAADSLLTQKMVQYLKGQQFTEQRSFDPGQLVYGAWGFGEALAPGAFGHVDLSHTRRVLQALREYGLPDSAVYRKAQVFLRLLQKRADENRLQPPDEIPAAQTPYDGGFYASPVIWGLNKAGVSDTVPRYFTSYATATADGLLALLAAGVSPADVRVQDALNWLKRHPDWSYPGGISRSNPAQWDLVLKFYHIAVRAEAYAAMGLPAAELYPALKILADAQQPEGYFLNPYGAPNKEDDPILATALAVLALKQIIR